MSNAIHINHWHCRAVTVGTRGIGVVLLGSACLSPALEKYFGGGGHPPGRYILVELLHGVKNMPSHPVDII